MEIFKICFLKRAGAPSAKSAVLPIWITDSFRPARARLVDGTTELLLGLAIIMELDITAVFGSNQLMGGQADRK